MKNILMIIGAVILFVAIAYGSWTLERKLNYKMSYQSQVETQIRPLVDRIEKLEREVSNLKTNR